MLAMASSRARGSFPEGVVGHVASLFAAGARLALAEGGQNVVEYGILIATIVMVVLLCVSAFGSEIKPWFQQLASHITTVGT
jgi:Flp pilus assembly pilin Flp